jgi:hypothetical protein
MLNTYPDTFALVQIHVGDTYQTSWGNSRAGFYSIPGTPTVWMDGIIPLEGGTGSQPSDYTRYRGSYLSRVAVDTDITIDLGGNHVSGDTYSVTATVCMETGGSARSMRILMVQVLDHWPVYPPDSPGASYSRNGFKQAASYQTVTLSPGDCEQVVRNFTFDARSMSSTDDIKIIAWAQNTLSSAPSEVYQTAIMNWPFPPAQAVNDDCENYLEISDGSYTNSTALATNDGSASCGLSDTAPDVWYVYTPNAGGILEIDTCGSAYNTVLSIHTFCPGTDANELECNDDDDSCGAGSLQSAISMPVTVGTPYLIRVAGYDGDSGDFTLNVTGPYDDTPPTPDPMYFDVMPTALSETSVTMTATTATDADTGPVEYYFEFVNVQVPGGHDSGWQSSTDYVDSGLLTNVLYGYTTRAHDSVIPEPNETAPSDVATVATFIETPQTSPTVLAAVTTATLSTSESFTNLTWNQSGLYFDCTTPGGDGGINEWIQTTSDTATDLTPDTQYTFRFKARNQDGVETDWSPERTRRTRAAVPSAPILTDVTCESVDIAIGDDINPEYTTYGIQCTQTDPIDANWEGMYVDAGGNPSVEPVYQTAADWAGTTVLGLAEETTYAFAAHAKSGAGITTDPGPEAFITTPPCSAIQCADLPDPGVCKGDANGDGQVTPADVGLVKYWYGDTDPVNLCYYDINCDGVIDPADVGLVKFWYGVCDVDDPPPCWAE